MLLEKLNKKILKQFFVFSFKIYSVRKTKSYRKLFFRLVINSCNRDIVSKYKK